MISEWRDSAKNLLYHFRCVVKGMIPFSPSWDPNKQNQVELDQESLAYIQTMSKILDERSKFSSMLLFNLIFPASYNIQYANPFFALTRS